MRIRRATKIAGISIAAASLVALSAGAASASGLGGDAWGVGCHGYLVVNGPTGIYGHVDGAGCNVDLQEQNVTETGWYSPNTYTLYDSAGWHYFRVCVVNDNRPGEVCGAWTQW